MNTTFSWTTLLKEAKEKKLPLLTLAPMVGVTDASVRKMCGHFGADVVVGEMVSTEAIYWAKKKNTKTRHLAIMNDAPSSGIPVVLQLFGKDPERFAYAAKEITQGDYSLMAEDDMERDVPIDTRPKGLDINFGCPAKKVFGHGSGAALFASVDKGYDIIKATCDNSDIPVSIKMRAGVGETKASDFVKKIKDLPIASIVVHGRTYEQKFAGPINLDEIRKVKDLVGEDIPVIVNGCIYKPEDVLPVIEEWPEVDGFAIARGIYGQPWIFEQIKELVATGSCTDKTFEDRKKYILQHAEYAFEHKGRKGIIELRKWLSWYTKGFEGARELRSKLVLVETIEEIKELLI